MFYDPYDGAQVKFHRVDPTGRIVPLDTGGEEFSGRVLRAASIVAAMTLAVVALWWFV